MNPLTRVTLTDRKILLGVSGSIAAYKSASLVRLLVKAGASTQVIMTRDATRFIPPLTLSTLSGKETLLDIFPEAGSDTWTKHIGLGLWADLFLVAPASAQTIAKLAHGFCDNMLTAVALAARCPIAVFPAMDHDMYVHPATQSNLDILSSYGYHVFKPDHGELASGLVGMGRLPEPPAILEHIQPLFSDSEIDKKSPLEGKRVLVSAGPTREAIDPIRFISNHSTGTMGFELAREARRLGANTTLVSGPTSLQTPNGVTRIDVVSSAEMAEAVFEHREADIIIMAAAVGDYRPMHIAPEKLKKSDNNLTILLERTTDILAELGQTKRAHQILVGFALETEQAEEHAKQKLRKKQLDWIVLNSPRDEGGGFGTETNKVTLFSARGHREALPLQSKKEVARAIFSKILNPTVG